MGLKVFLKSWLLCVVIVAVIALPNADAQKTVLQLDVVVRDGGDNPVTGLRSQDFVLRDNGAPQELLSFSEVSKDSTPPTVVLVFDLINNEVYDNITLRDKLTKFLQSNNGQLQYPTIVSVITATGSMGSEVPTTNGNALAKLLAQVPMGPDVHHRLSGGTGAQERINSSIKALNATLATTMKFPGRKLIFWMSEGWELMGGLPMDPSQEQDMFQKVIRYSTVMRQARITLYMLNTQGAMESVQELQEYRHYLKGVNAANKTDFADLGLEVLATQSGGLVLNSNDLALMIGRCLKDAGEHYEIEFPAVSPIENVAFHEVKITVNRPGTAARTRNGYYSR